MKVKIYVNTDDYSVGEYFPRLLTEKQYQEKIQQLTQERMNNLKFDDGFVDYLADQDYTMSEVFFLSEEEKQKIIENFRPFAFDSSRDELRECYEENEIEITEDTLCQIDKIWKIDKKF